MRVLAIVMILFSACTIKPPVDYANSLEVCMDEDDIMRINQLCFHFDLALRERYPAAPKEERYKVYLMDLNKGKIDEEFFKHILQKESFRKFIKTPTFSKLWKKNNSTIDKPYSLSSTYFDCANQIYEEDKVRVLRDLNNMDPVGIKIMAELLTDKIDIERPQERMFLALHFYFDLGLNDYNPDAKIRLDVMEN